MKLNDLVDVLIDLRNQHGDCTVFLTVGETTGILLGVLAVDTRQAGGSSVVVELSTEET